MVHSDWPGFGGHEFDHGDWLHDDLDHRPGQVEPDGPHGPTDPGDAARHDLLAQSAGGQSTHDSGFPDQDQALVASAHEPGPVIGDPDGDVRFWHGQEAPNSCAVAAQEDVLEAITGHPVAESQLASEAAAHGWYDPAQGTPLSHVGDLLEAHGVATARADGASLHDLMTLADRDVPVIVSVDSSELWAAGAGHAAALTDAPVIVGGGADHVVVVTGFDLSDPGHPEIVLNDSGRPDGAGIRVDLDRFEDAWADSGHYLVYPTGEPSTPGATAATDVEVADSGLAAHVGADPVEPVVGTSWTVPGQTESGHDVGWSTTTNEYYDTMTNEPVEPK